MQVHGGVDLRLATKPSPSHRRIPSDEALMSMAAYHRTAVPQLPTVHSPPTSPAASAVLPDAIVQAAVGELPVTDHG